MKTKERCNRVEVSGAMARLFAAAIAAVVVTVCAQTAVNAFGAAYQASVAVVEAGETWEVAETTRLDELVIGVGGAVTAPEGHSLTLTVNGVETGQKLVDVTSADGATCLFPGTYRGDVVLTVTEDNPTKSFKLRQALYLDASGVVADKSVLAAVVGDSYLTSLSLEDGSTITSPKGYDVVMTVDGEKKTVGVGDYKGQIFLTLEKL